MKSVQCSSPPWAGLASFPRVTPCSSQLWSRLVLWYDWIPGGLQQAVRVGRREGKRVYWFGAVHVCKPALWKWWMSPVSFAWVTAVGLVEGIAPWVIVTFRDRGNCCVILIVSFPVPKLPWVSDLPGWVQPLLITCQRGFPVGSTGLWRTSSETEISAFISKCPAGWFSCYWGCVL